MVGCRSLRRGSTKAVHKILVVRVERPWARGTGDVMRRCGRCCGFHLRSQPRYHVPRDASHMSDGVLIELFCTAVMRPRVGGQSFFNVALKP